MEYCVPDRTFPAGLTEGFPGGMARARREWRNVRRARTKERTGKGRESGKTKYACTYRTRQDKTRRNKTLAGVIDPDSIRIGSAIRVQRVRRIPRSSAVIRSMRNYSRLTARSPFPLRPFSRRSVLFSV